MSDDLHLSIDRALSPSVTLEIALSLLALNPHVSQVLPTSECLLPSDGPHGLQDRLDQRPLILVLCFVVVFQFRFHAVDEAGNPSAFGRTYRTVCVSCRTERVAGRVNDVLTGLDSRPAAAARRLRAPTWRPSPSS